MGGGGKSLYLKKKSSNYDATEQIKHENEADSIINISIKLG